MSVCNYIVQKERIHSIPGNLMTRKNHKNFANRDLSKYNVVDKRLLLRYENNVTNSSQKFF